MVGYILEVIKIIICFVGLLGFGGKVFVVIVLSIVV